MKYSITEEKVMSVTEVFPGKVINFTNEPSM